jgi:hypothetical protein
MPPQHAKPWPLAVTFMTSPQEHNCIDEDKLLDDIKTFGWTVLLIETTDYLPSVAYTVGLWKNYNHQELIAFGLSTNTLHSILNIGGELIKSGHVLRVEKDYDDFFDNGPVRFVQVDQRNMKDYFGYAIWFNQTVDFKALQLVWTDRNNQYPWDDGFEKEYIYRQPLLDRNAEFKFRETKNVAVFTTRQWTDNKKPILRVVHDTDGEWQFLTGDQMPEDIKTVALEQMTLHDTTLNDTFNLDYGEEAERKFVGGEWIRNSIKEED